MNYCEYCGEKLDKSTPFCPYCGKSLNTPEHILKYSIDNKDKKIPDEDNAVCSSDNLLKDQMHYDIQSDEVDISTDAIIDEEKEDDDTSSDFVIKSSITVEDPDEYTYESDTVSDADDQPIDTPIVFDEKLHSMNDTISETEIHGDYNAFITPHNLYSRGSKVMGIIGLVLGIFSVVGTMHTFLSTISIFFQHEKSAILQCFYFILMYGAPGIVAIILSQRAIDNGFNGGVSKAAEITGSIGTFCHIGVFFISIISLFI